MLRILAHIYALALVAASGASTLANRAVYEAAKQGPPQLAEFALAMLTFVLAAAGVLLVLYGEKLFEPAAGSGGRTRASTSEIANGWWSRSSPGGRVDDTLHVASLMQLIADHNLTLAANQTNRRIHGTGLESRCT